MFAWLLLIASSALAYGPINPSKMDDLANHFNSAKAADVEQAVGWFPGRCYRAAKPNIPSGNLLVIDRRPRVGPDGAVPSAVVQTKLIVMGRGVNGDAASPRYYDRLSDSDKEAIERRVTALVADASISEVYYSNQSLVGKVRGVLHEVRADDRNFYVRSVKLGQPDPSFSYCYFFKFPEDARKGH